MKFFTNEVKIAIVAIVGIVLLFFGLNFLKGVSIFSSDKPYYVRFADISGLAVSTPIYANGYQIGVVKKIDYDYTGKKGVIVKVDADKNLRIPQGSSAEIETDLMGNVKVNLVLASNSCAYVEPGDTIPGAIVEGMIGAVAKFVPTVEAMIPKIDSIISNINTLLSDPAIAQSIHNMQRISSNLTTTTSNLNTVMAKINATIPGMINKTNTALDKANTTLDNTSRLTSNLAAIDVASTMSKVDRTLANVQHVTDRLNSKESTLGLMMNDPSLYYNLNSAVVSADSLMTNIKAHPKRYVHFSIFGRKDK